MIYFFRFHYSPLLPLSLFRHYFLLPLPLLFFAAIPTISPVIDVAFIAWSIAAACYADIAFLLFRHAISLLIFAIFSMMPLALMPPLLLTPPPYLPLLRYYFRHAEISLHPLQPARRPPYFRCCPADAAAISDFHSIPLYYYCLRVRGADALRTFSACHFALLALSRISVAGQWRASF